MEFKKLNLKLSRLQTWAKGSGVELSVLSTILKTLLKGCNEKYAILIPFIAAHI